MKTAEQERRAIAQRQAKAYRQLLDAATAEMQNGEMFQQAIQLALDIKLFGNERELGQKFGVSRTQVNRWKAGRGLPGPASRRTIYKALKRQADGMTTSEAISNPRLPLEIITA